jgi:acetyl-CoA C-acetyltransferase
MRNGTKPSTYGRWITKDGLVDAYDNNAMGVCADLCATEYEFSREDQDNYAIQSYERSAKAWEAGKFDQEVPVAVPQKKGDPIISKDEEFTM